MLHAVPDLLRTVLSFLVVLGVLVFVHEFGHYLAARWTRGARGGVLDRLRPGADELGRPARHRLEARLAPSRRLREAARPGTGGGHVAPSGAPNGSPGAPSTKNRCGQRAIVVAAGPAANFVLAAVLFFALFAAFGRPIALPVVTDVLPDSAAAKAGIVAQDRIVAVDGAPITTFEALQKAIGPHPDERISMTVRHAGTEKAVPVTLGAQQENGREVGLLGIKGGVVEYQHLSVPAAFAGGIAETWTVTAETVRGVGQMIFGHRGTGELGGPLRIAQLSGEVAALGIASLISFMAVLSVNLGLINLFPIPVLDGGHLLFYLFEFLRGRPLPARAQEYGFRAGLALLVGLMVFATWNDLSHFGLFRWLTG